MVRATGLTMFNLNYDVLLAVLAAPTPPRYIKPEAYARDDGDRCQ